LRIQHSDITKAVSEFLQKGCGVDKSSIDEYIRTYIKDHAKDILGNLVTEGMLAKYIREQINYDHWLSYHLNYNGVDVKSLEDLVRAILKEDVIKIADKQIREIVNQHLKITYGSDEQ
jgi:oligoribonuclease (3'-5' exoribonuclease)